MGNPTPHGEGMQPIIDTITRLENRIAELERPDGMQYAKALEELEAQIATQVVPGAALNSSAGFTVTAVNSTVVSANVSVPAGYSRALVFASGALSVGQDGSGGRLYSRVVINGQLGPQTIGLVTATNLFTSIAIVSAANLVGLAGGLIPVRIDAYFSGGATDPAIAAWSTASIAAEAVFLR